jgi:hypothetical protein
MAAAPGAVTENNQHNFFGRRRSRAWPEAVGNSRIHGQRLATMPGCQKCGRIGVFLLDAMQSSKFQPLIDACVDPAQKYCLPLCQMLVPTIEGRVVQMPAWGTSV